MLRFAACWRLLNMFTCRTKVGLIGFRVQEAILGLVAMKEALEDPARLLFDI